MRNLPRSAFTLIELSIVLVIIGLIVGGVLVGQDLIKGAEIRAQVSEIEKINTVVTTFKLKYNCLPGDCKQATDFFAASTQPEQVTNGDGNNIIRGYHYLGSDSAVHTSGGWTGAVTREFFSVFDHLAAANLVSLGQYDETSSASNAPGIAYPKLILRSGGALPAWATSWNGGQGGLLIGYEPAFNYIPAGHKIRLGACPRTSPANNAFECPLAPQDAYAIDYKIDDGKPFSGGMVITDYNYIYRVPGNTINGLYPYCSTGAAPATVPANIDIALHNVYRSANNLAVASSQDVGRYCMVSIKAAF